MTIFNFKIVNYKRFIAFIALLTLFISSVSLIFQQTFSASAAITDCTTVGQNLITNCSFEDPGVLPLGYTTSTFGDPAFFAGYSGLTGWSMITPGTGNVAMAANYTGNAPHGDRIVDVSGVIDPPATTGLNGEVYGSGIEQTVTGLTTGQSYTLSFYQSHLAGGVDYPSEVNVIVDGVSYGVFTHTSTTTGTLVGSYTWTKNTISFTATSGSAVIRFLNNSPTPAPENGLGRPVAIIDNIVMTRTFAAIPELVLSTPSGLVSGPFTVTLCPSEPITNVDLGDFNITNGTASGLIGPVSVPTTTCAGGEIYTVTVTPITTGSVVTNFDGSDISTFSENPATSPLPLSVLYDLSPEYTSVHIESNNAVDTSYATTGNTITLTYTMDSVVPVEKQAVTISGVSVSPTCVASVLVVGGQDCTAILLVPAGAPIPEGIVIFEITDNSVGGTTTVVTTDFSSVTIDRVINVIIDSPVPGDDLSTFSISGQCEIGAGAVTISGSGFSVSLATVPCSGLGTFQYGPVIGVPGAITITATQTDLAGNIGVDTNLYGFSGSALPIVTITGPVGMAAIGPNSITGTCTTLDGDVTIYGSGFGPSTGTVPCVAGVYVFPITINGNTTITASQTNTAGTTTAYGSTSIPGSSGGSSGGGGCISGYPCDITNPTSPSNPISNTPNNGPMFQVNINNTSSCPMFKEYLKQGMRDGRNGVTEVSKVQNFLNRKLGIDLSIDGVFGKRTKAAVKSFQTMHIAEILAPWGLTGPTGWWYQSTRSYANYLENCSEGTVPLDNGVKIQDGKIIN